MKWIKNFVIVNLLSMSLLVFASDSIDLSGQWRFALDSKDAGYKQKWYRKELPGNHAVFLPGSIQQQGYGDVPGPATDWTGHVRHEEWNKSKYAPYRTPENFKMPFWLQPDKYYKGPAWYQKTITIPRSWKNKRITLELERPHWQTRVWVDNYEAGSTDYLSVRHIYDLSELLTVGEHTLTIQVDNREVIDVGVNSHSISDHTQSNWNGIVGEIKLNAEYAVWIEDVQVYPDLQSNTIKVIARLDSHLKKERSAQLVFEVSFKGTRVGALKKKIKLDPSGAANEVVIPIKGPIEKWDEFTPNLYKLKTKLKSSDKTSEHVCTFGMRQITTEGNRMILNGRRIFMRGTLECCIFPKTGYPPTDVASWKRIINICKSHGLNHIRFHSWCPPQAAFISADELGFYYQVECSSWANYGRGQGIGNGKPVDQWLYDEADAILKDYGNHPSFLLFAFGNEPAGPESGAVYLRKWVEHYKQKDSRRLVTSGSGWPLIEESHYHVTPNPRIQQWGEKLNSRINSRAPETVTDYRDYVNRYPDQSVIAHEIGQWCVYPDFDEVKKYTGVLKPKNFEIFQDFLEQKQMLDQARDFLMASGKLQTLCYKEDIESALRTPNFGGFQLLDLHDFPGQGTALVGVLDPFWDSKPYVSPAEYKRFSGAIVPLARLAKRTFTQSETLAAQVDVSQFGSQDLIDVKIQWSLLDSAGKAVRRGVLRKDALPAGDLYTVGNLSIPLSGLSTPARYKLELAIENTDAVNDWDVWIYPETVDTKAGEGILIAGDLSSQTLAHLQQGGSVLLVLNPSRVKTDVKLGFSSIFWNTAWTSGQPPHTLGILCDPEHPALAAFPTDYHSNWQWSVPIQNAAAMQMDHLPASLRPIVQVVPDWFNPQKLGLVFEAKVGSGSIIVCSVDIINHLENQPVQKQLRRSLLNYMESDSFRPVTEVDIDSIQALFARPTAMQKRGARILKTDSHENGYEGHRAIDNDPETFWHTRWSSGKPAYPHDIQIGLKKAARLKGLTYLPRQDQNQNGWIKEYAVYVSDNTNHWGNRVAEGVFEKNRKLKRVIFKEPVEGQYVRFIAAKGFGKDVFASIAEIELIFED